MAQETKTFAEQMRDLENRFATAAAVDGDVYLPNFTPRAPVDAVLICMEPSLKRWARTPDEAAQRIAAGFRNFIWSPEDFILHFAARRSLCAAGETYQITDVSKGAMTVQKAQINRLARYQRWTALLAEELRLIAKPNAHIIAVGAQVSGVLSGMGLSDVNQIMHYSPLAASARHAAVKVREAEFRAFSENFRAENILDVAAEILRENAVPSALASETLGRLQRTNWSESRKKLAFIYTTALARLRTRTV